MKLSGLALLGLAAMIATPAMADQMTVNQTTTTTTQTTDHHARWRHHHKVCTTHWYHHRRVTRCRWK